MGKPVSGKQKKAWLQAKRAETREKAAAGEADAEDDEAPPPQQPQPRRGAADARAPPKPRALSTQLERESDAAVQRGRTDATRPLVETEVVAAQTVPPWPAELQPALDMPRRPRWSYSDTVAQLEARERAYFDDWCRRLQAAHGAALNRFERNLEVWRQLWRTVEVADVILVVVDARTPLLSFPAPLLAQAQELHIPMVVALNKADLLPPGLADGAPRRGRPVLRARAVRRAPRRRRPVAAWARHLHARFPGLAAVVPFLADPGAAPKGAPGGARARHTSRQRHSPAPPISRARAQASQRRRAGHNRWRSAQPEVADSVRALRAALCAQLVPRLGVGVTLGQLLGEGSDAGGGSGGGGAAAAAAAEADDEEEELRAASAALTLSAAWAEDAQEDKEASAAAAAEATPAARLRDYATIGVVGEPNMGKSSLINRLFCAPVVKASPTPGCTKRLQTLFLARRVRLADCPGLIFPKAAVPLGLQLLSGNYPIAQAREPFAAIRYLAEAGVHPRIQDAYALALADAGEGSCAAPGRWSPFALAEALAVKRKYLTRGGRPDVYRAANRLLRDALAGRPLRLCFAPPGVEGVRWPPRGGGGGGGAAARGATAEAARSDDDDSGGSSSDDDGGSAGGGGDGEAAAAAAAGANPWALLGDDAAD